MRLRNLLLAMLLPSAVGSALAISPAAAAVGDLTCTVTPQTGSPTTEAESLGVTASGPATIAAGSDGTVTLALSFDTSGMPATPVVVLRNLIATIAVPTGASPLQSASSLSVYPAAGAASATANPTAGTLALRVVGPIAANSGIYTLNAQLGLRVPKATAAGTVISPKLNGFTFDITAPAGALVAKASCVPSDTTALLAITTEAAATTTSTPTTASTNVTTLLPPAPKPYGSINDYGSAKEPTTSLTPGAKDALSGKVFRDDDGTGTKNINEPGLAAVPVVLKDGNGNVVFRDTTNAQGIYTFANIEAGTYTISVEVPVGYAGDTYGQAQRVQLVHGARLDGPNFALRALGATTTAAASTSAAAATTSAAVTGTTLAGSVAVPATKPAFTGSGTPLTVAAGLLAALGALGAFAIARRSSRIEA